MFITTIITYPQLLWLALPSLPSVIMFITLFTGQQNQQGQNEGQNLVLNNGCFQ